MNPFDALGLPARAGLADEEVRAAWRHAAARMHPDRDDGGNPAAYTAAAAAYGQLRTPWGRSEALADLAASSASYAPPAMSAATGPGAAGWRALTLLPARARHGRPLRLAARTLAAAAVAALALVVIPGSPSAPAIIAGCALWLAFTAGSDLAPPPGR